MKKESSFKMKGFSGFGDKVSTKPTSYGSRATRNAINYAKANKVGDLYTAAGRAKSKRKPPKTARGTKKIVGKGVKKVGTRLLGPIGGALVVKDAYNTYKDVKGGMKIGKALRKNFLGF